MPYEDAKTYRFNPFDMTKTWPHTDYPLITVGTMTLNENPENFFAADRAGGVLAGQHGSGHRPVAGQDAARTIIRLQRRATQSDRHQLPPTAGQPTEGAR